MALRRHPASLYRPPPINSPIQADDRLGQPSRRPLFKPLHHLARPPLGFAIALPGNDQAPQLHRGRPPRLRIDVDYLLPLMNRSQLQLSRTAPRLLYFCKMFVANDARQCRSWSCASIEHVLGKEHPSMPRPKTMFVVVSAGQICRSGVGPVPLSRTSNSRGLK